ncbi:hypothetical protein RHSIM_Rhsim05G0037800 [Rhododendron simsii]|uniref:PB1 domain-containing protein n=1 Tax=Rhododendron simsii TaxID=118357 RepID=A0A834LNS1_RHOSS|nr:hypothetical protein RHSIM_Rhsim05G0037800 [Rhododendron simsii]
MEGEPGGQNQGSNECRRDFMERQIALNPESGLIMGIMKFSSSIHFSSLSFPLVHKYFFSFLQAVSRPPDQHGERNTSTARETPSHNVQTGIEGVPVGQNQEANEFRLDFTEDSIPLNTENRLIIGIVKIPPFHDSYPGNYPIDYKERENAGSSFGWASQVNDQSTLSTSDPNHHDLVFSPPQITSLPSENRGGSIDLRNSVASQAEPFSDRHISGSRNLAFRTCSYQAAPSQHVEGQAMQSTDHNAFMFPQTQMVSQEPSSDRHISGFSNFATCSDQAAPSQHVGGQSMPTVYPDPNAFEFSNWNKDTNSVEEIIIKAFCGERTKRTVYRFRFPLTSGIDDLKKELSKRLNVEVDRFEVKYKDKYKHLISIPCDEDFMLYLSSSLGNDEIRVFVLDKVGGTPNFCERCRSSMQTRA